MTHGLSPFSRLSSARDTSNGDNGGCRFCLMRPSTTRRMNSGFAILTRSRDELFLLKTLKSGKLGRPPQSRKSMLGQGGPSGPPLSPVVLEAVYGRQRLTRLAGLLESGQGGASSGASGFPVSQPDADETAFWNSTLIVMPKGANVPPLRPSGTRSFSSALSQAEVRTTKLDWIFLKTRLCQELL